ncbi:MAG: hypothetical protein QG588_1048, partial [Candidatus Poribacteria bacterium]|nr:hypothetical protein [Candidatus Poribacteria bacterium]
NLLYFMFICVFVGLLNTAIADNSDSNTETVFYQGIHPDEFMKAWFVLGPIPVFQDKTVKQDMESQKKAFANDFLTQYGGETNIKQNPDLVHQIDGKEFQWQVVHTEGDIINLIKTYGQKDFAIAYAYAEIDVPDTTTALLGIGSDDGVKVWLNGKLIHENWISRGVTKDDDIIHVTFQKGRNQILLKVQNQQEGWGFACRIVGTTTLAEKLVSSAEQGDLKAIERFLSYGVDVNSKIEPGITALQMAKIRGRKDVSKFLLEKGANPDIEMPAKEKIVDMFFNRFIKHDSPGAAVAIIKDDSILYTHGYGIANMEYNIPITPSTVFDIASVSKQFTGMAILMLAQQGKLSLDDDIHKYLPEVPDFGKPITIKHLIHHTSGIRDWVEIFAMSGGRMDDVITYEDILKMVRYQKGLNFDPGEEHLYSNTNYNLLAEIVARVSGQSFSEYTEASIFKPLGMTNTHFHDNYKMIVNNRAYPYEPDGTEDFKIVVSNLTALGSSSLFTTAEDMAKWLRNFNVGQVGGSTIIEQMHQLGVLNNGKKVDYAFGLSIGEYRGLKTFGHGGLWAGYVSYIIHFPEQKFAVAVLGNQNSLDTQGLAMRTADVYLADQLAPEKPIDKPIEQIPTEQTSVVKIDPALYDEYAGGYELAPGYILNITNENNQLLGQVTGQIKFPLTTESENSFSFKPGDILISFQRDEAGKVMQLTIRQYGQDQIAKRIETVHITPEQLAEFTGDYYSDELGTTYTMVIKDGNLVSQHRRHEDAQLAPATKDQFVGGKWWFGQVSFTRGEDHKVNGFNLTGERVRNLRFDKQPVPTKQ